MLIIGFIFTFLLAGTAFILEKSREAPITNSDSEIVIYKKFYTNAVANVRKCPSLSCEIVGQYPQNTSFELSYKNLSALPEWVEIFWQTITDEKVTGYINKTLFSTEQLTVLQSPPTPQTITLIEQKSTKISPQNKFNQNSLPPEKTINPRSIVGILCFFDQTATNIDSGKSIQLDQTAGKGSGVLISKEGLILTNRHIVERNPSVEKIEIDGEQYNILFEYELDHCEVGQIPKEYRLPTISEIRQFNPEIRIPVLGYKARVFYKPPLSKMSSREVTLADFAILEITGITKDGPSFGITSVPYEFPYAEVLAGESYLKTGDEVITYGAPGYITEVKKEAFNTIYLLGSVGSIERLNFGDKFFADVPLTIYTNMEVSQGRSGSPLFWRGYVIGLIQFYEGGDGIMDNRTKSGSVASDAIIKVLRRELGVY